MGEISRRLHRKLTKLVPPGDIDPSPQGVATSDPSPGHPQADRQGIRPRSCRLHLRPPHHVGLLGKRLPTPRDANLCPRGRQRRGGIHALGSTDEPAHDEFLLLLGVLGPQDRKDDRHAGGVPHRSQRLDLHEPGSVGGSKEDEPVPHGDLRAQRDGGQPRPAAGTDHRPRSSSATAPRATGAKRGNSGSFVSFRPWSPNLRPTTSSSPRPMS